MSAKSYPEHAFETHIVEQLTSLGGYTQRSSKEYDRELCLIPDEVIAFLRESQPKAYEALQNQYGEATDANIVSRISKEIGKRGTLDVLRRGVSDRGQKLSLVYFRPSSGMNPEHAALYAMNRLVVVRQLMYSKSTTDELDLALFVNGLPIITAELKNSLTGQKVEEAKAQYRSDRSSREPLFQFKRCLVHFAVGNEQVFMTTRLADGKTRFLPFNRDTVNPPNPEGHASAYLWNDTWRRETLLDLLQNYLHLQRSQEKVYDPKKGEVVVEEKEGLVFPRFHQLDVVRKLLAQARRDGAGHNYLVQHSAGSGKSNSIAWLAHGLRQLYAGDDATERLFDTIIVITDRRVLDRQLQNTITQFEQTSGTVVPITESSAQLKEALEHGRDIVVTTMQKFPVISDAMTELGGKRFAVIIDEAHSSQSGETSKHVKKALSAGIAAAVGDDDHSEDDDEQAPPDLEEEIVDEIRLRGRQPHISYFAFTATPKNKTLELFGTPTPDGRRVAFHIYSMRQAIEERFILDVLKNYTTFKRYFKLATAVEDDRQYERPKAIRALTSYVDLTPHAIGVKTRIMLDHFMDVTERAIEGRGRAMLVTRSRLHAVKYFLEFRRQMKERGLRFGPLVAFSGTVRDPDTGAEYTEASLNRLPQKVDIPDALKLPDYRILIVANKYQTGFDEPNLHTMWVDKKLGDVNAVQTLSRLNRTAPGKADTVVLDFVNEADTIREAFQEYYQTVSLEEETDPNKLYDLQTQLEGYEIFARSDVDDFAAVFFDDRKPGELLQPILDRVVAAWRLREEPEREEFRSTLQSYVRLYAYVAQLITFQDVDLEKLYVFARNLNLKLDKRSGGGLPRDITDAVDLDSFRIQETYRGKLDLSREDATLAPISADTGMVTEPELEYLSRIVNDLNDAYGLDLTEQDRVRVKEIIIAVKTDPRIEAVMAGNNSVQNRKRKLDEVVDEHVLAFVNTSVELYKKLSEARASAALKEGVWREVGRGGSSR